MRHEVHAKRVDTAMASREDVGMAGNDPRRRAALAIRAGALLSAVLACAWGALGAGCGDEEGTSPPAQTSPDASSNGDGATGGDGSTKTDANVPITVGPVDPDKAARAAVVLGACVPDDGVHRYLADIYYRRSADPQTQLIFNAAVECLATKNNGCQAVADCTGTMIDIAPSAAECVDGCNGTVRTACDGRLRFREDCSRYNEQCVGDSSRSACAPAGAPPCIRDDAGIYTYHCVDGKPAYCTGPVEQYGVACASIGLVCENGGCKGTEGACTDNGSQIQNVDYLNGVVCANGTLQACLNGGLASASCASFSPGFTCQTSLATDSGIPPKPFCGLASECNPPSRSNLQCDGDSVVVCNAGRIDKVDCKTLGFTTCNSKFGGCTPNLESTFVADGG